MKNKDKNILIISLFILVFIFILVFNTNFNLLKQVSLETQNLSAVEAGKKTYVPLEPIPGLTDSKTSEQQLGVYLGTIFNWAIAIAIILSIIFLLLGGIQYMTTDAIGNKEEAKGKINAAIVGLLLALSSFLILETINPQIVNYENNALLE
jgi:membrane-associated protease RseP (regulator of RpoE activity)